jgi:hypothetical protein
MSKYTAQDEQYYVDFELDFLESILKRSGLALTKIKNQESQFAKDLRAQVDAIDKVVLGSVQNGNSASYRYFYPYIIEECMMKVSVATLRLYNVFGNMKIVAESLGIGIATIWRWNKMGIQNVFEKHIRLI